MCVGVNGTNGKFLFAEEKAGKATKTGFYFLCRRRIRIKRKGGKYCIETNFTIKTIDLMDLLKYRRWQDGFLKKPMFVENQKTVL